MGHGRVLENVSADFIDEVHRTEEEIDLFLKARSQEAQEIMASARKRAEEILKVAEKESAETSSDLRRHLLEEADKQARLITESGLADVQAAQDRLHTRREAIINAILQLLMEPSR